MMATQTPNCEFFRICRLYCINEDRIQLQLLQTNRNLMFIIMGCIFLTQQNIQRAAVTGIGSGFSETRADFSVILLGFLLLFQDGSSHYIHNQKRKKRENRRPELGHITSFSLRESWEKWFLSLQVVQ